jgi:hypothetical protein
MKSSIVKNAEPAKGNFCPCCKNKDAKILTPIGSRESFCHDCKKWFKAKLKDVVVYQAENKAELMQNWLEVLSRINRGEINR